MLLLHCVPQPPQKTVQNCFVTSLSILPIWTIFSTQIAEKIICAQCTRFPYVVAKTILQFFCDRHSSIAANNSITY